MDIKTDMKNNYHSKQLTRVAWIKNTFKRIHSTMKGILMKLIHKKRYVGDNNLLHRPGGGQKQLRD
jgi:hypothetical protein